MVVLNSFKRLLPVGGPQDNAPTAENHASLLVMVVSESFASRQLRLPKPGKGSLDHPAPAAALHVPTNGYVLSGSRLGATADAGLTVGMGSPLRWEIARAPSRSRPRLFAGRGSDGLAPRSRITPSIVDPVSAGEQRRRAREFADRAIPASFGDCHRCRSTGQKADRTCASSTMSSRWRRQTSRPLQAK